MKKTKAKAKGKKRKAGKKSSPGAKPTLGHKAKLLSEKSKRFDINLAKWGTGIGLYEIAKREWDQLSPSEKADLKKAAIKAGTKIALLL